MKRLIALGIFGGFLFFSVSLSAQVPQLLNYQGRLTDDAGTPITTATTLRFSLYQGGDAATPGSGTLVYQEDASVTPDDNGVFSHLIGSGTPIYGTLDSTVFQTANPVYLEITIDPAGANETLLPRKQIVTVGYSFKSELADDADTVDGQDASAFAPVVHNHDPDYVNEGQADSVNTSMILDDTIVDADINASANIAASKIDPTGLDADLLDGKDSEAFVHTTGDDMTGTLNVNTKAQYALYGTSLSTISRGVYGWASATSGITYGVYGQSDSVEGRGVYGYASHTSGYNYGVYGRSDSAGGYGVYGFASASTGITYGIRGASNSTSGRGVFGYASASSGTTYGVYGESKSTDGIAVYGYATRTSGTNYGVYGRTNSTSGYGVYGFARTYGVYGYAWPTSGVNYGIYGKSDSVEGCGVYGIASAPTGLNYGVYGQSDSISGYGVYGYTSTIFGATYGVYGQSNGLSGTGVYGYASASEGTNHGLYGKSNSTEGYGVYGTSPNYGVYGEASGSGVNYGVYGATTSGAEGASAVYGKVTASSGWTFAVYGENSSTGGRGVYGYATATDGDTFGVGGHSESPYGRGVFGQNTATSGTTYGVYGVSNSPDGYGLYGSAPTYGVYGYATATTGSTYGVYGKTNSASGYAGYFKGRVRVTGDFTVDGNKSCVQPIDNGKKVLLYAMESPEIWFEDFGSAQLVNGHAVVLIEKVFAQTANIERGYLIFLTPIGECNGLYISRQDKDSFEVREQGGGTSNISFYYRIVAKRRGYEEVRFEEFTEPEQSPAEPNLPVEKK